MKVQVLALFVRGSQVLLGWKKRGLGADQWNGIGGHVQTNEGLDHAMIREAVEEIGLTPLNWEKAAELDFIFPGAQRIKVYVYVVDSWMGHLRETDEIDPMWFDKVDLPYDYMWDDDPLWMPAVLVRNKRGLKGTFQFERGGFKILRYQITMGKGW